MQWYSPISALSRGWRKRREKADGKWRPWFAWHPVRVNGDKRITVWLETVYRCAHDWDSYNNCPEWTYSLEDMTHENLRADDPNEKERLK